MMWFLRGAGRKGLSGIAPVQDFGHLAKPEFIRPLLGCSKAEILEYLERRGVEYRVDRTNDDTMLLRNWIMSSRA